MGARPAGMTPRESGLDPGAASALPPHLHLPSAFLEPHLQLCPPRPEQQPPPPITEGPKEPLLGPVA